MSKTFFNNKIIHEKKNKKLLKFVRPIDKIFLRNVSYKDIM